MADLGHELTDRRLAVLERDIAEEYATAVKDMQEKLKKRLDRFEADNAIQKALLDKGAITKEDYQNWRFRHAMMNKRWEDTVNVLAEDMHHTNEVALKIARNAQPDIYALNANYGLYEIESGGKINTGLSLYNHDSAEYLLAQERQLMPGPSTKKAAQIAADKDLQWNKKKIQSAVLQGVLQGESVNAIAERLSSVGRMNYNAAVRYARTMTTNTQNAGRYNSFRRCRDLGVQLTIEWQATLDGRTRHEHRMMHGQRREVDEPFVVDGVEIMWPGNDKCGSSTVPQEMIWNCRCTLLAWVKGFEGETVKESPDMGDMSFEEWQHAKEPPKQEDNTKPTYNTKKISQQIAETPALNEYTYWSDEENQKRFDAIKKQTGFSDEKTEKVLHAFSGNKLDYHGVEDTPEGWFYRADTKIRKREGDKWKKAAETIDEYIIAAPKYEGTIYRGLSLSRDKIDKFTKNAIFQENGALSSWSSSLDVAQMFAEGRTEEYGLSPVIIETTSHPFSSPVAHLSLFGSDEQEVLVSNMHGNTFHVSSVEQKNGITFVKLIFGE